MSAKASKHGKRLLAFMLLAWVSVIAAAESGSKASVSSETPCVAPPGEAATRPWGMLDLNNGASCGEPSSDFMRAVDAVSVRVRPDSAAPRQKVVGLGAVVEQLGREGNWTRVRVEGRIGWINSGYLEPLNFAVDPESPAVWLQPRNAAVLRSAPGLTNPRIGSVSTLQRLQQIARDGDWTRVRYEERGWLHGDYLVAATGLEHRGHLITTEGVNLRFGPSADTGRINAIGPGQWVQGLQLNDDWVQVRVERRGWIHNRILEPWVGPYPTAEISDYKATAIPKAGQATYEAANRAGDDGQFAVGEPSGNRPVLITAEPLPDRAPDPEPASRVDPTAMPAPSPAAANEAAGGEPLRVLLRTVDAVSLRVRPDRAAPRYNVVVPGAVVEQVGRDGDWTQVRVDNRTGWIDSEFLEPLEFVDNSDSQSVWLQPLKAAVLRSAPGVTSVRIGSVSPGRRLQQMASHENWTRVRFEERGWLHNDYLDAATGLGNRRHLRTTEGVNLRAGPGAHTAKIDTIGPDQWVEEMQRVDDWVQVRVERRGWIYSRILGPLGDPYLARSRAPTTAPTTTPVMATPAAPASSQDSMGDRNDVEVSGASDFPESAFEITGEETGTDAFREGELVNQDEFIDDDPCVVPSGGSTLRPGVPVLSYESNCDKTAAMVPSPDRLMEFPPVPDRWRIVSMLGYPQNLWDPYAGNNPLKGDLPLFGEDNDWFFNLLFISDTVYEPRRFPVPVGGPSTLRPGGIDLFGSGRQTVFNQNFLAEFVLYKGDTIYKPPDYEFRFIPVFNYSIVDVDEISLLKPSPGFGLTRREGFVGIQGLFFDKHLRNVSTRYDFDSVRIGIQPFSSDFRGFLFQDNQFGIRLFGTRDNNFYQYNLAWFRRLEKDANSGLNDITERGFGDSLRDDDVFVFNVYRQDFPRLGFISQLTLLYNRNREADDIFYEDNGFIQRPASLGTERSRDYDVVYLGYNGDGHFGRNNLTTSFYLALGDESNTTFTDSPSDIRAWFFAAEYSRDYDWVRPKFSLLYGSGDSDPFDGKSQGYDAVFENPQFAGADTSFWIRQGVPLIGGGRVALSGRNGILNSLRSSKEFGQSNFINPGIVLLGVGADMDLTPELRFSLNANQLWFDDTASVALARNQANVGKNIGLDFSASFIYRPFASQNIVLRASGAALFPGQGYKDLFGDEIPYSILANLLLQY